jgi:diguanylate cyclase (GGDEF)-like protein
VVSVVFAIGILNLAVGFALAVLLERPRVIYLPHLPAAFARRECRVGGAAAANELLAPECPKEASQSACPVAEHVPATWWNRLKRGNVEVNTVVEASAHVLMWEVGGYCQKLQGMEESILGAVESGVHEAVPEAVRQLIALNEDWQTRQCEVVKVLTEQRDHLAPYAALSHTLEAELLRQTPLVDTHNRHIAEVDLSQGEAVLEPVMREVARLFALAHSLRDLVHQTVIAVTRAENRWDRVAAHDVVDTLTGLDDRLGLELRFHLWWRDDPERARKLSVALVDIDRFAEKNESGTTRVADSILSSFGRCLGELAHEEEGAFQPYRYSGQRFLLFFADAQAGSAATTAERFRQTMEATRFEHAGCAFQVTFSAAVSDVRSGDDTAVLFGRLEQMIDEVRRESQGNQVCLTDGDRVIVLPCRPPETGRIRRITIQ